MKCAKKVKIIFEALKKTVNKKRRVYIYSIVLKIS